MCGQGRNLDTAASKEVRGRGDIMAFGLGIITCHKLTAKEKNCRTK